MSSATSWWPAGAASGCWSFSLGFGPESPASPTVCGTDGSFPSSRSGATSNSFGDDNEASVPDPRPRRDVRGGAQAELLRPIGGPPRGGRGRRSAHQFHPRDRAFCRRLHGCRQADGGPAGGLGRTGSPAAAAGFQPGDLVTAIDGRKIDNFVDMQRIVGFAGGHPLTIVVDRGGVPVTLTATPEIKNDAASSGNPVKSARRRQGRERRPARRHQARSRQDLVHRRNHLVLHQGRVCRATVGRPDRRSDRNRPDIRAGRGIGMGRTIRLHRRNLRLHRPVEPVSGSPARWGSPFVLLHRGDTRAPLVGAGSGGRIPDRPCNRRNVDDFCHGE